MSLTRWQSCFSYVGQCGLCYVYESERASKPVLLRFNYTFIMPTILSISIPLCRMEKNGSYVIVITF